MSVIKGEKVKILGWVTMGERGEVAGTCHLTPWGSLWDSIVVIKAEAVAAHMLSSSSPQLCSSNVLAALQPHLPHQPLQPWAGTPSSLQSSSQGIFSSAFSHSAVFIFFFLPVLHWCFEMQFAHFVLPGGLLHPEKALCFPSHITKCFNFPPQYLFSFFLELWQPWYLLEQKQKLILS